MRRLTVLLLAVALMAGWAQAYRRLSLMGSEFLPFSRAGVLGFTLYLRERYGDAARAYRQGLHGRVWATYNADPSGFFALRAGDLTLAQRRAGTTLMLVPGSIEPTLTLGEIALERGQFRQALVHFDEILARQSEHADALLLSAIAAARLGEHGRAIDAMNRALRHSTAGRRDTLLFRFMELAGDLADPPPAQRPLCLLAHIHRYLRIFDEASGPVAIAYARQAIAAGDRPADAYLAIGIVHDKRGEHVEALKAMQQAVAIDSRHAEAYRWAAVEAGRLHDPALEYRMIRAAFEAAPTDPFYLPPLERVVLNWFGDARTMAELMQRAIERDPGAVGAHERLARAAEALGELERAAIHTRLAAELRQKRNGP